MTDTLSGNALRDSLPDLFVHSFGVPTRWEHVAVGHWLARVRDVWRLAGCGPAFDEMRRLIPQAGSLCELCLGSEPLADLLVIESPLAGDQSDPAYWTGRLAPGAVVMVVGVQPGEAAASLWCRWRESVPGDAAFDLPAGPGLGLLLPTPEHAPTSVRELCAGGPALAALFDAAYQAAAGLSHAQRWREAETARAAMAEREMHWLQQAQVLEARVQAGYRAGLQAAAEREQALSHRIEAIEGSNTYRVAMVLQRVASRLPDGLRVFLRRALRLAWWTLRGRLREGLHARREALRQRTAQANAPSPMPPAAPAGAASGAGPVLSAVGAPMAGMRVAFGIAVAGDDPFRVQRVVGRARSALAHVGQARTGLVLVADDGAAFALENWLPPETVCLSRGAAGFVAAHRRLIERAFEEGADVYVLTDPHGRFDEKTLADALAVFGQQGPEALVQIPAAATAGLPRIPGCFVVISRALAQRVGELDEHLDASAALTDLALRADVLGLPVVSLPTADPSLDLTAIEATAQGLISHRLLGAAWWLAHKWRSAPLIEQVRSALEVRGLSMPAVPPPATPGAGTSWGGRDHALLSWWRARTGERDTPSPPVPCQPIDGASSAVPEGLDQSLAVPFALDIPLSPAQRVAAVVHLWGDDTAEPMRELLRCVPAPCDLFIRTDDDERRHAIAPVFADWAAGSVDLCTVPYRDGKLAVAVDVLTDERRHDLVLHLHDRQPLQGAACQALLGSPRVVASVLAAFSADPLLGVVFPQHSEADRAHTGWQGVFGQAEAMARDAGLVVRPDQPLDFPAAGLFWARPAALAPLRDLPAEAGQSGGFEAALRLLPRLCEHTGHTWVKLARPDLAPVHPPPLVVHGAAPLREHLRAVTFLLSDRGLWTSAAGRGGWRLRPDPDRSPRLTLLTGTEVPARRWAACQVLAQAMLPGVECRAMTVPLPGPGLPPPLDTRASEVFLAADGASLSHAVDLVERQRRFFGHGHHPWLLSDLTDEDLRAILRRLALAPHGELA